LRIPYGAPPLDHWSFVDGPTVRVKGRLTTNDGELAHAWALEGAGLMLKSVWDIREDLEAGRLEVVLPNHHLPGSSIHAVYPHSRLASAKVRLFVDFLRASFKGQWAASLSTVVRVPDDFVDDDAG
jgi:DNA-binding transcriptional LysR family regulator